MVGLRDFHAENIIWRGVDAPLGLLDFQDAVAVHPAYDLVSVLQDARRSVPPQTEARQIARYVAATGADPDRFGAAYALLGAARNLRIMGIFARLCLRDGKPRYLDFMPRVWDAIQPRRGASGAGAAGPRAGRHSRPHTSHHRKDRSPMRQDAPDALMLFAAGRGTRMAPLTDRLPKPLIAVGGQPLLDRALDLARAGGAARIVVNTHHLGDQIRQHLEAATWPCPTNRRCWKPAAGCAARCPCWGRGRSSR